MRLLLALRTASKTLTLLPLQCTPPQPAAPGLLGSRTAVVVLWQRRWRQSSRGRALECCKTCCSRQVQFYTKLVGKSALLPTVGFSFFQWRDGVTEHGAYARCEYRAVIDVRGGNEKPKISTRTCVPGVFARRVVVATANRCQERVSGQRFSRPSAWKSRREEEEDKSGWAGDRGPPPSPKATSHLRIHPWVAWKLAVSTFKSA